ncbi:MAG: hypothetical protein FWE35_01035 [Streptosporangiales bacterium]|nr:hypothetical protein [Streptosporangiales bacterium]
MARHRTDEASATGTGGVPSRYQAAPNENGRFDIESRAVAGQPGHSDGMARLISRRTHRHRHALRPWLVIGPLAGLGTLAHLVPPARPLWWIPLLAGAVWAGAAQLPRRKNGPRSHLYYALACTAAASGWLALVTASGLTSGPGRLAVVLIAVPGFFPLSWLWWQYHRIRPAGPRAVRARAVDPVLEAWETHVAAPGKLLPRARLLPRERPDGAATYLIMGVRGRDTTKKLTGEEFRHSLASALGLDPEQINLEKPPKGSPDRYGFNARLIVIEDTNAQHAAEIAWPGPSLDRATGTWSPGVYPDGPVRCALYQVRDGEPVRALNNAVSGLMNHGKSRLIDLSVLEMLHSGLFVVWYADGQEGSSGPALKDHVDWYATRRAETVLMLKCAYRIMRTRGRYDQSLTWTDSHGYERTGRGYWPASPEEPFLQVILDECQELLKDPWIARIVKDLQRLGPKFGVGVTLVTQEFLMHETGGQSGDPGAQQIRAFAQTGIVALFKAGSDINANALGGALAGVNPRLLPDESGWCFLLGRGTRPVPARTYHADPDGIYDAMARAAGVMARLDARSVRAAGEDYAGRWERLAALAAADSDDVAADIEADLEALLNGPQPTVADGKGALVGATIKQAVYEIVRAQGPIKRGEIETALAEGGRTAHKSTVDQALASWQRTGHVISKGAGMWDIPDREDQAAADAENRAPGLEAAAARDDS